MVELPCEIITEILLFAPVESILRFRCVSQKWCDVIDNPYFVKTHLNRSNQNNNQTYIFTRWDRYLNIYRLYSLKTNNTHTLQNMNSHPNTISTDTLYTPILFNGEHLCGYFVRGSCNGLLLLEHRQVHALMLFNPSTRQHRHVPPPPLGNRLSLTYGLGYDSVNDDYKIIRADMVPLDAKVYSLKSDLWQNIAVCDFFINCLRGSRWRAQVNGAIHVIRSQYIDGCWYRHIVAFDLANANFYLVPTLDVEGKGAAEMSVMSFGGFLCLIAYYENYMDVWVMKVYGVKESWTKLISIPSPEVKYSSMCFFYYFKSGDEVVYCVNGSKLNWYDLKRREIKNIEVSYLPNMYFREVCVESLVPLTAIGEVVTQEAS